LDATANRRHNMIRVRTIPDHVVHGSCIYCSCYSPQSSKCTQTGAERTTLIGNVSCQENTIKPGRLACWRRRHLYVVRQMCAVEWTEQIAGITFTTLCQFNPSLQSSSSEECVYVHNTTTTCTITIEQMTKLWDAILIFGVDITVFARARFCTLPVGHCRRCYDSQWCANTQAASVKCCC
jgi:hypothetical protein